MKNVVMLAVATSLAAVAGAADCVWTGQGQTSAWADVDNWSKTPESGDIAKLPAATLVTAVSDDMTTFALFSAVDIPEGSTLFFSEVKTTITVPFTGKGRFLSAGGDLTFKVDNTDYQGIFAMTNTYARLTSGVVNPLGTTNTVWFSYPTAASAFVNGLRAGDGITGTTNVFHFAGNTFNELFHNSKGEGFHFYGPVYFEGTGGAWKTAAAQSYFSYFHGGFFNGTMRIWDTKSGYYGFNMMDGGVSNATLQCCSSSFYVDTWVQNSTLIAGAPGQGFRFGPNADIASDVTFQLGGSYDGGYFDLDGNDVECGEIYIYPSKTVTTWADAYFTSEKPATVTCRGTLVRNWNDNAFIEQYIGLIKGAVSFCYDWDGRTSGWGAYRKTFGKFSFASEGNDTTGCLTCSNGTMSVLSTATFPNLTGLRAMNTGKVIVETAAIGNEGDGLVVTVADSGVLTIAEGVTIAAKSACIGGKWIDPKPGETYGGPDSAATVKLDGLAGKGILTVAEYGGPKGLLLLLK